MRFNLSPAMLNNHTKPAPPAIVQQAKDWRYYESAILKLEESKGQLLHDYKESGAWKEHYKSWEAACVPFEISKRHADRLIAEVKSGTQCPASTKSDKEATLNKVVKLPDPTEPEPKEKEEEKPRVKSSDEPKREEPKAKAPARVLDSTDHEIPKTLHATWEARQEIQALISAASDLRCAVEECQKKHPRLFTSRYWDKHHQMHNLDSVHHQLTQIKPDVVCPECNGSLEDDQGRECKVCALTGFISKQRWHHDYEKSNTSFIKAKVAARNGG